MIHSLLLTHAGFALWGFGALILCLGRSTLDAFFLLKYYTPVLASALLLLGAVMLPQETGKRDFAMNCSLLTLGLAPFITWEVLGGYSLYTVICAHASFFFLFLALNWQSAIFNWYSRHEGNIRINALVRLLNWGILFGSLILYCAKIFCIWYLMSWQLSLRDYIPDIAAKASPAMFRQLDFWNRSFEQNFEIQMEAVLVAVIFIQAARGLALAWRLHKKQNKEG